jgi:uncharacterized protein YdhG (YjbR/CyaY superfamily)
MDLGALYDRLSSPARRALDTLKLKRLEELARYSRSQVAQLHGIGPKALETIDASMKAAGISLRPEGETSPKAAGPRAGFASMDDYIRRQPKVQQKLLQEIRGALRAALPGAEETISYSMPAFYQKGIVLYFAAYERHIGLYPTASGMMAFQKDFSGYKSSKGAVQFPLDKPMPMKLIVRIAKFRAQENERKHPAKKK